MPTVKKPFWTLARLGKPKFKLPVLLKLQRDLVLYLVGDELRLAAIETTLAGKKEVAYLASLSVRENSQEAVQEKFQKVLAELKIKNPRIIGLVPSHWAITRNIEIPSRDPHEIQEIVNLQAQRHTPYARSEIIVHHLDLGISKRIYTKILLIIVPRAAVKPYYDLADKFKINIEKICFIPDAIARSVIKYRVMSPKEGPVCFINVDRTASEFLIISKGLVLFVRSIPIGIQHFVSDKTIILPRFAAELKRSLESYQSEGIDENPSKVILAGGSLDDVEPVILEGLGLPIKRWIQGEALPMRSGARSVYANPAISFLSVVVPALLSEELKADLIPEDIKLRGVVEERNKEIVKLGILSMACLGLIATIFLSHFHFRRAAIAQTERRFEPIKAEAKALEEAHVQIQTIKAHLVTRGQSLETLSELFRLVPIDMYLTSIRYEKNGKFSIKGTTLSRSTIFALVDGMEQTTLFRHVQTKYVIGKTEKGQELAEFEIVALLE